MLVGTVNESVDRGRSCIVDFLYGQKKGGRRRIWRRRLRRHRNQRRVLFFFFRFKGGGIPAAEEGVPSGRYQLKEQPS